ncbi:TIGR00730 family Rossman fold protein [Bacteriovoracaceae bacterium]|nr:TIGR00730 family Rossman fold protein [Bacteriovoracaceae bacterium]
MKICVFCGASKNIHPNYQHLSQKFAQYLSQKDFTFSYGGASVGLMGYLADACLKEKVHVTGIIPESLSKFEVSHTKIDKLIEVKTMHDRKAMLYGISDQFVVFPGGMGTLDEFFEILTWKQLGFHQKPITIFNNEGYFDELLSFFNQAIHKGFIRQTDRNLFKVASSIEGIFE